MNSIINIAALIVCNITVGRWGKAMDFVYIKNINAKFTHVYWEHYLNKMTNNVKEGLLNKYILYIA